MAATGLWTMKNIIHREADIELSGVTLQGELTIPPLAKGIIIFSHGSGSSRHSPRNKAVASFLRDKGFGTLLLDLLTPAEDSHYENRFDIELLTSRLIMATEWLIQNNVSSGLLIGYFGASTGAASALKAAARNHTIGALVSRGGRPDMAMDEIENVKAPALLIVGSLDTEVIELNRIAYSAMKCPKSFEIVPGASHLFEEPGTLDRVAELAAAWFEKYLV
jgi:dienelactone hydrolase